MKKKEYFKVKAEVKNSVAASFCVGALDGFATWVKYKNRNYSSDLFWAFCDSLEKTEGGCAK